MANMLNTQATKSIVSHVSVVTANTAAGYGC